MVEIAHPLLRIQGFVDRTGSAREAYLSPLRQTTFFHSGLCRRKAKRVGDVKKTSVRGTFSRASR